MYNTIHGQAEWLIRKLVLHLPGRFGTELEESARGLAIVKGKSCSGYVGRSEYLNDRNGASNSFQSIPLRQTS